MPEVVEANCPHCKKLVRIPIEWIHQPMRCKHCRQMFQARQPPGDKASKPAPPPRTPVPPQVLRGIPISPGQVPPGQPPVSRPKPAPASIPSGRGWWRGAIVAAGVLLAAIVLVVFFWDQITGLGSSTPRSDKEQVALDHQNPADGMAANKSAPTPATVAASAEQPRKTPSPKTNSVSSRRESPKGDSPKEPVLPKEEAPRKGEGEKAEPPNKPMNSAAAGPFPRRALAISASNYLLANPLNYGDARAKGFPGSSVRMVLNEFGNYIMQFPNTQLFELSDGAPRDAHPPLKTVMETAIVDFLNSARAQDRVVLLFAGHATEIEKEAYLVPFEAPVRDADPKELISLSWLYDRLKECQARQKVLILDVCRFDPARGEQRPGSGPMGEVLDARLQQPPPGVQVWSSCVKGQQAYEFERGSVFLQALCAAMQEPLPNPQGPGDALPLDVLVPRVNRYLEKLLQMHKLTQTSRLAGAEADSGASYDPHMPLAAVVRIKPAPVPMGDMASPETLQSIVEELRLVPPVHSINDAANDISVEALPRFPAKALEPYQADYASLAEIEKNPAKYPLRVAVLKAARVLRDDIDKFRMKEVFNGRNNAQVKQQVAREQVDPGKSILALKEALDELKNAGETRKQEKSKRWQANYDYVLARLESRLVYVYEYSYVLALIRSDSLPPLENGATGYRLGAKKKVSIPESEVKAWVKEIDRTWQRLAKDNPNTPWAVVANRERLTVLGLEWRPTRQ
jgi:Caspase domain